MSYVTTTEETKVYYEVTGNGSTALLFVHGWMGNSRWWDAQRDFFQNKFTIVQMDHPGHGKSETFKNGFNPTKYAKAIKSVADVIHGKDIILVGHSMSGAYVLEASVMIPRTKAIVIVDTLKNFDQLPTYEQAEEFMFVPYRKDFKNSVETLLPQFLFASLTPASVKERLIGEFLSTNADHAIEILAPLYKMDVKLFAKQVKVPVLAINSDFQPTNIENNRRYIHDYHCVEISGTGHYPMLEKPQEFNFLLNQFVSKYV